MKNIIEPSQNIDYDDVFETIQNDAQKRGLSDEQVWEIWQAGIAAQQSVQRAATAWCVCTQGILNADGICQTCLLPRRR